MNDCETANIATVGRVYDLVNTGDVEAISKLVRSDIVVEEPEGLPYGGHYAGLADYAALFAKLDDTWSEFKILSTDLVAKGDRVWCNFQLRVRSKATGESLDTEVLEAWELEDGLITRIQPFYFDTHALRKLCGLDIAA